MLDRHIEQVKQNLADEVSKCERDTEEKKNNLYDRILDEAEQSHVKDEITSKIRRMTKFVDANKENYTNI